MRDLLYTESNMEKHGSKAGKTNDDTVRLRCSKGQTWIKLSVGMTFPSVLHSGVEYALSQRKV